MPHVLRQVLRKASLTDAETRATALLAAARPSDSWLSGSPISG